MAQRLEEKTYPEGIAADYRRDSMWIHRWFAKHESVEVPSLLIAEILPGYRTQWRPVPVVFASLDHRLIAEIPTGIE